MATAELLGRILKFCPPEKPHDIQFVTEVAASDVNQLIRIAAHTAHTHERIFPFLLPPWRKTCADYPNRVTIEDKPAKEDKTVTEHLRYVSSLKTSPSHIIVYTDGSQRSIGRRFRRTGTVAVGFHQGNEIFKQKIGLGGKAEVYDAELTGLVVGIRTAITKADSLPRTHHIHIFADNISAIKTVSDPKPHQGQLLAYTFYQHMLQWLQKNPVNTLRVVWCLGHLDILDNEQADQLAKEATLLPSSSELTITHNICHACECLKRD